MITRLVSWWYRWRAPRNHGGDGGGGGSDADRERALIERARSGGRRGQAAFAQLVETHQTWLVWFLQSLLGNRSDAEDVAQDVFVRAYLALDRFRGDARFRTWIRRIAINQAFNHQRAHRRHAAMDGTPDLEVPVTDTGAGSVVALDALMHGMEQLSYVSREILVLHHVEEMALQDIAQALDIGLSAAKMRLQRARQQFRVVLGEDLAESAE